MGGIRLGRRYLSILIPGDVHGRGERDVGFDIPLVALRVKFI